MWTKREMFGVERGGSACARGEKDGAIVFADHELDRKAARRRNERRSRQIAGGLDLSLALGPDDRVDVGLDDPPRIGVQRDLGVVPRLDLMELVLAEQRENLILLVDEGHHLVERHAGHEESRPQHDIDHRPVARREDGCLRQLPAGGLELGARRVDLRLRHPDLRLGRRDLCLDLGNRREVSVDAAGELFSHLLLGGARCRNLAGELVDVRLRLLEIEAIAGAGGDELGVLLHSHPGQIQRCRQRLHLFGGLIQLLAELALSRTARRSTVPGPRSAAVDRRRPWPRPPPASPRAN